jgi:hypothetical protein
MAAYGHAGRLSWPHAIEVDIVTLDQLIELYGAPAFIKLDVEGYEPQTLAGLHSAPRALSFEYNVRLREQAAGCIQQAAALGRCVFNFSAYEHGRWQWPQWLAAAGAQQALQALPNDLATGDFFVKYIVP